jgi:hypothetical protein
MNFTDLVLAGLLGKVPAALLTSALLAATSRLARAVRARRHGSASAATRDPADR